MVADASGDEAGSNVVVVVKCAAVVVGAVSVVAVEGVGARVVVTGLVVGLAFRDGLVVGNLRDPVPLVGLVLVEGGAPAVPVVAVTGADTACTCGTPLAELAAIAEPSTSTVVAPAATTSRVVLASTPGMSD